MKIIFIVHYFPPLNSTGARRINAFAKYLNISGDEITVITTKKSNRDGLLTEPVPNYLRLIEINNIGCATASPILDKSEKPNMFDTRTRSKFGYALQKLKRFMMKWLGQSLDHRILFAFQFASPFVDKQVKNALKEADMVISSCPPWPTHLAGYFVKLFYKKPWIADYRDTFSGNHVFKGSRFSRFLEHHIDRWMLKIADVVIAISEPMKDYYEKFHPKVYCVENGYDSDFFKDVSSAFDVNVVEEKDCIIRYVGSISNQSIPQNFLKALAKINEKPGRRVIAEFYGESSLLRKTLGNIAPEAKPYVTFYSQQPYQVAIKKMITADALFFKEISDFSSHSARGVLTTKIFEYLASKKPIIAEISSNTLVAKYIQKAGLNLAIATEYEQLMEGLEKLKTGKLNMNINHDFVRSLSREAKTQQLQHIIKNELEKKEISN